VKYLDAVKAALKNGPLMTTMMVYADFPTYSSGVYKHVTGSSLGGHAVSIIGFEDSTRSWIIRNSWGEDWGEKGFAHISYDDTSGIGQNTWQFAVPQMAGYVTVRNPIGRDFVSGVVNMKAEATFPKTSKIDLTISGASGEKIQSLSCTGSPCQVDMDSKPLADGKYEVFATAHWGDQNAQTNSQHEQFYVLNSQPTLALSFTGAEGLDLTKPLSERVVFDIHADSTPVPFSSLQFHVSKDGTEVFSKLAPIVLSRMTLGWRTTGVPNGKYEIWFTGKIATTEHTYSAESAHTSVEVKN
jgi:hypothetical protein